MWSRCLTLTLHNKKCLSHLSLTAEQALQQIKHASIVTVFFITHNWKVNNKWYWAAPLGALMSNPKNTSPAALMLRLISFGTFLASFPLCRTNVMIAFGSRAHKHRDTHPAALSVSGWRSLWSPCETVRGRLCLRSWERGRSHWGQVPWALYWPTETWGASLCSVQLGCSMGSYRCVLRELHLEERKGWLERGKKEEREN